MPLGLPYISSAFKKKDYNVFNFNLNSFGNTIKDLAKFISNNNIDVVCSGGLTAHYFSIKEIFTLAKEINSDIITILGGGILTSEPELMLKALNVDFGVVNEGEETIVDLAHTLENSKNVQDVRGLVFLDQNKNFISTTPRNPIKNLSEINWPDFEGFGVKEYLDMQTPNCSHYLYPFDKPRILPMISSRSCPFSCTFCYHPLGKKYRERPLEDFFKELEYLVEAYQINMVELHDELFSVKKERMTEFCKKIKQYHIKWFAQFKVNYVDEDTLKMVKDAGCYMIGYGLESMNLSVLKSMRKKTSKAKIERALSLTRKAMINIQGNFIFGDPAETEETAQETLDWWKIHREYQINMWMVIPYPGSQIYLDAIKKGIIKHKLKYIESGCPEVNLTAMSHKTFYDLQTEVYSSSNHKVHIADPIYSKKMTTDHFNRKLYELKVRCPHCSSVMVYKNLIIIDDIFFILGCRKCNQRFNVSCNIFGTEIKKFTKLKIILRRQLGEGLYYRMSMILPASLRLSIKNLMK